MNRNREIGERIKIARNLAGKTQREVANQIKVAPSTVMRYENGSIEKIKMPIIEAFASVLEVNSDWLVLKSENMRYSSSERDVFSYENILPVSPWRVPLLGSVAAGEPLYDPEDFDVTIPVGAAVRCDFALRVKGDSMKPTYLNGDIVLVRDQQSIDNGRIAVVAVGEEVTLKHVYRTRNGVTLGSDNPDYPPLVYIENECDQIRIMGKPVAFLRGV